MRVQDRMSAVTTKTYRYWSLLLVVLGMIATSTYAETMKSAQTIPASVSWDPSPAALLISYRDVWGEFANQDPTPLIRIYGDGRVLVHHPHYTPRAGQYELWLQTAELEELLLSLLSNGFANFEPAVVKREKQLEELSLQEAMLDAGQMPELFMVADDSTSVFEVHVQHYQAVGAAQAVGEVTRQFSWLGLATDARRYPQLKAIQQLRSAELELKSLLERDDLGRIR